MIGSKSRKQLKGGKTDKYYSKKYNYRSCQISVVRNFPLYHAINPNTHYSFLWREFHMYFLKKSETGPNPVSENRPDHLKPWRDRGVTRGRRLGNGRAFHLGDARPTKAKGQKIHARSSA
ncbi:hypothetical protein [Roseibium sediminicola]|uniref:Uncharacterized protein n=1 Tax=Roseibium sediminicola TaxID=2933272 RepID=A0ABT0GN20_9HYPH|nr:hypothetical protein [Roseibium sp. CAU 1639]MCK7610808.1 hypothetical protein [Roseibium sp. CAU 1639]